MDANLIFDLGLHKGEDSEFYLKKGFRVIGVEASEELCKISRQLLKKYIDNGQMEIIHCAIGDKDLETVAFYKNTGNSVWGTVNPDWAKRNEMLGTQTVEEKVRTIRLDTLIKRFGMPYYLKIDIEGTDLLAIKQIAGMPERPKFLSLESEKISWEKLLEECSVLQGMGYSKFKVIDQLHINEQKSPDNPLEGKYARHSFKEGCSGLFGKELPGDWMGFGECIKTYKKIFRKYRMFGDYGYFNNKRFRNVVHALKIRYPEAGWYDTHVTS